MSAVAFPHLQAGQSCPRTLGGHATHTSIVTLGDGPVYPILGFSAAPPKRGGVIDYQGDAKPWRGDRWENKVLIAVSPRYTGAFTVEGERIDGSRPLTWLVEDERPAPKLEIPEGAATWRYYSTSVLLASPGCYALRMRGSGFDEVVVFQGVSDATYRRLDHRPSD